MLRSILRELHIFALVLKAFTTVEIQQAKSLFGFTDDSDAHSFFTRKGFKEAEDGHLEVPQGALKAGSGSQ